MNCGSGRIHEFLDLGEQPNGNNFPLPAEAFQERIFPLSMMVCKECWQVQISQFPPQDFLFSNHPYVSGLNEPVVNHFETLSRRIVEKLGLDTNSMVFDIGCNDGTLLKAFEARGMRTLGIDPGKRTGKLAKDRGVSVCQTFWNQQTGKALRQLNLAPKVITATAVFYHMPDLHEFTAGLAEVMDEDTVFVVQCVYLKDLLERLQFDHFYHEHSCIHAISPLQRLFAAHGLRIIDVEFVEIHGGSFVLYVGQEENSRPTSENVAEAVEAETAAGLFEFSTYQNFSKRVHQKAQLVKSLLDHLKAEGKSVFGLGAPVKGNTLLSFCGIDSTHISMITEINQFKIGRITPGTHIPVIDEKEVIDSPDYYLLLSWNFRDFFVEKYSSFISSGGKIIVPEPDVEIISADGIEQWRAIS